MKITYKTILIAALILVVFGIFRKPPLDKVILTENLEEVVTPVDHANYVVDFELCDSEDNFESPIGMGSTKFKLIEKTEVGCKVETSFESPNGFFVNECTVPFSVGTLEFDGNNFDQISQYCTIATS